MALAAPGVTQLFYTAAAATAVDSRQQFWPWEERCCSKSDRSMFIECNRMYSSLKYTGSKCSCVLCVRISLYFVVPYLVRAVTAFDIRVIIKWTPNNSDQCKASGSVTDTCILDGTYMSRSELFSSVKHNIYRPTTCCTFKQKCALCLLGEYLRVCMVLSISNDSFPNSSRRTVLVMEIQHAVLTISVTWLITLRGGGEFHGD